MNEWQLKANQIEDNARKENKAFFSFLYLALSIAAFLIFVVILENQLALSFSAHKVIAAITLLLVVSNILIAMKAQMEYPTKMQQLDGIENSNDCTKNAVPIRNVAPNVDNILHPEATSKSSKMDKARFKETASYCSSKVDCTQSRLYMAKFKEAFAIRGTKIGDNFTILEALLSWDMWILFIATTCGQGAGLAAISNIGQNGESLGYTRASISTLVSLMNIWTFLGRLLAGFTSEALMKKKGIPDPSIHHLNLGRVYGNAVDCNSKEGFVIRGIGDCGFELWVAGDSVLCNHV
ncbi:hypothetical protein L7F22_066490 [Adiantum nelumboides]|nr:hypothetical protein [Adiantum nelumboides]